MKIFLVILFIYSATISYSQAIKGKILNDQGNAISFVTVRIDRTAYETVSNSTGNYQLEIKKGINILIFSANGYENVIDTVNITESLTTKNINLKATFLSKIQNKISGEEIMKNAIDKRNYFQDFLSEYSCDTYCFTSLKKENKDSISKERIIGKNKLKIIEWKAKTAFKSHANFRDEFYAVNDFSNDLNIQSYNYSAAALNLNIGDNNVSQMPKGGINSSPYLFVNGIKDIHFSIFDNTIVSSKLTQNPLVSPLAYNSLLFYDFSLKSSFKDSLDQLIYEIEVNPKYDFEALFNGVIFIRDKSWEVVSYNLGINPEVLLFFKEIRIICNYEKMGERLVPVRREFNYIIKEGASTLNGMIRIYQKEYSFTKTEESQKYWLETGVYDKNAFDKGAIYWNEKRPYILKDYEKDFIHDQDSVISYHKTDEYLRKNDSVRNQVSLFSALFFGLSHVNAFKKFEFSTNPLSTQLIPFGVGGFRYNFYCNIQKEFKNGKKIFLKPLIDYGFYNTDLKGSFETSFLFNRENFSKIGIQVGELYEYVNNTQNLINLYVPTNRVRNQKVELNYSRELVNGLYVKSSLLFSNRQSIDNIKYPDWMQLFGPIKKPQSFKRYKVFLLSFDFEYHFQQKYVFKNKQKIVYDSRWPTLYLNYTKGIPDVFHSKSNFDLVEFKVQDNINLNSLGAIQLSFLSGLYLQKNSIQLIENKYFRPSDLLYFSNPTTSLQFLDTAINTSNAYLQFNVIHHFKGFFLNKIFLINKLKLEEAIGGSILSIPNSNFFQVEFFIGVERRFRIRKEIFKFGLYAVSKDKGHLKNMVLFKLGFNPFNSSTDKWDY